MKGKSIFRSIYPATVRKIFTLIELLVVIAVIAILSALLLPALKRAKEQGSRAVCLSNLKQLHVASINYANDWDSWFPSCTSAYSGNSEQYDCNISIGHAQEIGSSTNSGLDGITKLVFHKYATLGVLSCPSDASPFYTWNGQQASAEDVRKKLENYRANPALRGLFNGGYGFRYSAGRWIPRIPNAPDGSVRKESRRIGSDSKIVLFWDSASEGRNETTLQPNTKPHTNKWPHVQGGHMVDIGGAARWVRNRYSGNASGIFDGVSKMEHWPAAQYSYQFITPRKYNTWGSSQAGYPSGAWMTNPACDFDSYFQDAGN